MLARILPQPPTPALAAIAAIDNIGNHMGNINNNNNDNTGIASVYLSHPPLGTVMPAPACNGVIKTIGPPQQITVQPIIALPPAAASDTTAEVVAVDPTAVATSSSTFPNAATSSGTDSGSSISQRERERLNRVASTLAALPIMIDDHARGHLLRNTTILALCGSIVSIAQACLFIWLWIETSSGVSAQERALMSMFTVPLSCLWASFLIFTFWIPKKMLPQHDQSRHTSS
jgi:hypothetical protein